MIISLSIIFLLKAGEELIDDPVSPCTAFSVHPEMGRKPTGDHTTSAWAHELGIEERNMVALDLMNVVSGLILVEDIESQHSLYLNVTQSCLSFLFDTVWATHNVFRQECPRQRHGANFDNSFFSWRYCTPPKKGFPCPSLELSCSQWTSAMLCLVHVVYLCLLQCHGYRGRWLNWAGWFSELRRDPFVLYLHKK